MSPTNPNPALRSSRTGLAAVAAVAVTLAASLTSACSSTSREPPAGTVAVATSSLRLETDPGMSGLTTDAQGNVWGISERARCHYRIQLDGTLERHAIADVPDGYDLESIAALPAGGFLVGTEGPAGPDDARVLRLAPSPSGDGSYRVEETLPSIPFIAESSANRGVEGLCASGDLIVAGFEIALEKQGARFGQVVVAARSGERWDQELFLVALTSKTGKLADLACTFHDDRVDVLAIERHYEVSRIIRFSLPRATPAAPTAAAAPVRASAVLDLTALAAGRNFEGVALLADGRLAILNDNQQRDIVGPTELLLLPAVRPFDP